MFNESKILISLWKIKSVELIDIRYTDQWQSRARDSSWCFLVCGTLVYWPWLIKSSDWLTKGKRRWSETEILSIYANFKWIQGSVNCCWLWQTGKEWNILCIIMLEFRKQDFWCPVHSFIHSLLDHPEWKKKNRVVIFKALTGRNKMIVVI